ncbi:protein FAM13C [Clupea harengus]|uniref:Protein FAM13C n=1 Tax=Clupea harengus TaxID=7950 RepID=A0A6P8EWN2_CLUHA|nr:protein FAM13C [Clupea harengus]
MFCFCLQSPLLKLQALDGDGCPSPGDSPEDEAPCLGTKEGPPDQGPSCWSLGGERDRARENSPPEPQPLFRGPQAEGCSFDQQMSPGPSRILHHITDGNSPLPSPRCPSLSQSQRFNTDPEMAPSPPCSQHLIMARGIARTDAEEVAKDTPSIPLLTKHIQALKRKIRKFEERFEQEMNYKPSHNDKSANPEILRLMGELAKTRKQLKELRLKQSVEDLADPESGRGEDSSSSGRSTHHHEGALQTQQQPHQQQQRPALEETVDSLLKRLKEKRQALGLPENMLDMTHGQMALEKMTLQKCLLYFESLHGRPGTKQDKNLVKPLYDRYQMVKRLLCASSPITTIEEEEGSDEDCVTELPTEPYGPEGPVHTEEEGDSDPAFVSPMDEVKAVRHTPRAPVTMANLHEASRSELLACMRETRVEKRRQRKALREFEDNFSRQMGR